MLTLPALSLALALVADASAPVRVVRSTPTGEGSPRSEITVMFDRPVAGSLERSVDPARVMRLDPALPGRFEWRDPVTLRFVPSAPMPRGARITVTVSTEFTAMDGTRLAEPFRFTFRVLGPQLIQTRPVSRGNVTMHLLPNQRFELAYSEAVDAARFEQGARILVMPPCTGRVIPLRVAAQRAINTDDGYAMTEAGGWQRDRSLDSLRRIVQVVPRAVIPRDCPAELVVPEEVAEGATAGSARFAFRTFGALSLVTAQCGWNGTCPTGPLRVTFGTPVRGADVLRHVSLVPAVKFAVHDTNAVAATWTLDGALKPRTTYAVVADTALRDTFGQRIAGNPAVAVRTSGFSPSASYPFGRQLVERVGFRTLAVEHVNADTLIAEIAAVPDSLERAFLSRYSWGLGELWAALGTNIRTERIATRSGTDRASVTGLKLPVADASRSGTPTLFAIKVRPSAKPEARPGRPQEEVDVPVALVQVTDLGVTARVGPDEGTVWVTGVSDGLPRAGATVVLHDAAGERLATARTDAQGIARLRDFPARPPEPEDDEQARRRSGEAEGYVTATLGPDRAVVPVNRYDPDLSPWSFGVSGAWDGKRFALAGAVFTERGIYRPGEEVIAKAIVRDGPLGALRLPARGDSLRWVFTDRDGQRIHTRTVALSAFGTSDQRITLPAGAPIGQYEVLIAMRRQGSWQPIGNASFRIAEFRPPEFLMDLVADERGSLPGERFVVTARGRYLFGAPMAAAALNWSARHAPLSPWELEIPGMQDWTIGRQSWSWADSFGDEETRGGGEIASGIDTLDAAGEKRITLKLPAPSGGSPARVTFTASITDVNRQVVGNATTTIVHPAAFYVAAKPRNTGWFWREGQQEPIDLRTVRPDGTPVGDVEVRATLVRREWHQVRRERNGMVQLVGEWVSDTVERCTVRTGTDGNAECRVTPKGGGVHVLTFEATDAAGRSVATSMSRWVAGTGFVPWSDETQFKMDLIADRDRYSPGDTATILLAAPLTNVEAWLTVERERVIESRRLRLTDGATTVKIPITEAHAPNVYVSVVAVRGRSAAPGSVDDPGRPTLRVGYVELRVTPEVKRLSVAVTPSAPEYLPGDSARLRVQVRDKANRGERSEVTLWAVDEGVLALTRYKTPDPIDLLYARRALGLRLASNLVAVAPQVPEGEKGFRAAGGGGGAGESEILRSQFKTTAFFLGSVVTDAEGNADVAAKLPDNLTTFRVMAVAVTAGDRYGSGESPMLVTRPLVARPSLPRFVRPGDRVLAGTALNLRSGAARAVSVNAKAEGIRLQGIADQSVTLAPGRGGEARFRYLAVPGDSAKFTFSARSGSDADAVRVAIPVKPDHHPRSHVVSGVLRDTATVRFDLPADIDPARSILTLRVTSSPLSVIRGALGNAQVYPYDCTEQIISGGASVVALLRVPGAFDARQVARAREDLTRAVRALLLRQRTDGGIGYWSPTDWTTPWLSAHAGALLLDAKSLGIAVDSAALGRLAEFLHGSLRGTRELGVLPVAQFYESRATRLADQVASADFLSRFGQADVGAENELLRMTPQLRREDRVRLAELLRRRGGTTQARELLQPVWDAVRVEGQRAVLDPAATTPFYFPSTTREMARLLIATLAIEPGHRLVGPMVETMATQGRIASVQRWNTQDATFAVKALSEFERLQRELPARTVRVRAGRRVLASGTGAADSSTALTGLLGARNDESRPLTLSLDADALAGAAAGGTGSAMTFYHLTVTEVPLAPPVRPAENGIRVERWYERFNDATPVTSVAEGELVRVRLRVTVAAERQFVVLDDPLPGGFEAIDLSLRTVVPPGSGSGRASDDDDTDEEQNQFSWGFGMWDSGWWTPWDHREIRDDRVVYSAVLLWPGTYTASYVARATTAGTFVRPPAHAEEMYNPAVNGRSEGGTFVVTPKAAPR
ncbi:MAG TPA: MG2 domain-containing protein [Gemmatimonadaceae bacterium]|nr:MG2 domain-containing protein [Gemmatimonadaceae bacterium]